MRKIIAFIFSLFFVSFSLSIACPCKEAQKTCPNCNKTVESENYQNSENIKFKKGNCEKCAAKNKEEEKE
ncbi:hypothetical protein [Persephonella sp. IF05-L8]|uniref:hypothetical protein n=1 Tax=Persephonella sp. IF05-L8 TaxID=1158338 RepID=UPI0004982C58